MILGISCADESNPASPGFNLEESDEKAIEIADMVMEACGGRATWDNTDYLQWNFFGSRIHQWNKKTGDLVINNLRDTSKITMNLETMEGSVTKNGENIEDDEDKKKQLQRGKEMWINDSYWLLMPLKLKDSGVTLKYLGEEENQDGDMSYKLELTFAEVGVTPYNKYHVYVNKETNLVNQWDFFTRYDDPEPRFSNTWTDYKSYDGLMLSSGRGNREISDIEVGASVMESWGE